MRLPETAETRSANLKYRVFPYEEPALARIKTGKERARALSLRQKNEMCQRLKGERELSVSIKTELRLNVKGRLLCQCD